MSITHIILDKDGTLTDMKKEFAPFVAEYPKVFCEALEINYEELESIYKKKLHEVRHNINIGFEIFGHDACPGGVDPILAVQTAGQLIQRELLSEEIKDIFCNRDKIPKTPGAETSFLFRLLNEALTKFEIKHSYREGKQKTQEFLEKLLSKYNKVSIVTTATPERTYEKVKDLGFDGKIEIISDALKFYVEDTFKEVPEILDISGDRIPRKVLLRRPNYARALTTLAEDGFTPERTTMIGDIFELDGALPLFLGYKFIQMKTDYTPEHEETLFPQVIENHHFAFNYKQTLEILGSIE